ncbi:HAD-IA family hydrolase [Wenxinia marina]|uniref:Haloacid dehalogenase superfamily, subfamily IA, variant 3 with third motif having DD or ED n=1 Tax=Wenxinia marina DSM 24838 TaxID=1123501 RepID=A0A0D0NNZ1_9RHOB|nr:HAD-IA family hydrolase [Wenxinia marina]KIQ70005.1 haloacid dehalogenase superfamily, subfamily IA, variant 3 with third motif having DD or ED [Wenxinia marina DSM 24838]GGL62791.1 hydrolase [Wenxinia marina]
MAGPGPDGVRGVVFDIGNVLIEWNPERLYDRVVGPERRTRLFAEVDLHSMNNDIDAGAPFEATVTDWAARHPDWADEIGHWHRSWGEMASPVIAGTVELLEGLRAKGEVGLFALSNIGVETFAMAVQAYPFLGEFDTAFVSGEMRIVKPDPAIYAAVEEATGLGGPQLLFIDDRAENVEAAASRGWNVHQFDGPDGLAARLADEGLLERTA